MANKLEIQHWNTETEGELTEQKMRHKLEEQGYSVSRYVYAPGTYFPDHTHGEDKIDAVLSGRFRMTMDGQSIVLEAGDCLSVPKGAVHSAEVVGGDSVVSLDAIRHT
jgi:quercetin dioxygenase-like cupin family protein